MLQQRTTEIDVARALWRLVIIATTIDLYAELNQPQWSSLYIAQILNLYIDVQWSKLRVEPWVPLSPFIS